MTNKELIELSCSVGVAEAYGQIGASKILEILTSQKKAEIATFKNNHELQFSEKFTHENWVQNRNRENQPHRAKHERKAYLHGISFTYPIAFCKFQLGYDKVQQDDVGIFHGTPWIFSCVVVSAADVAVEITNVCSIDDTDETNDLVKTALEKLKSCNTILAWGLEQTNLCNQLIGDKVMIADMQSFTTGYFFQEVSARRKQLYMNSALSVKQEKKGTAPSKQSLYNEVFDESWLEYIRAELQTGRLADADKIGKQLMDYCAIDTHAMHELFKLWIR